MSEDAARAKSGPPADPEISFVMPCYNEEEVIEYTIPRFVKAFEQAGYRLELVACDNGSSDRTGEILARFVADGLPIVVNRVEVNEGYGHGVLMSIPVCSAPWIGIIPADGQVDAEDVVRVYESVMHSDGRVLAKVHRRFRLDGPVRSVIAALYNLFMLLLWPKLGSFDVNGSPKLLHRSTFDAMKLESKDWLLDAEMMIKAQHMGLRVLEMNVFARMREHGTSHVAGETALEFVKRLLAFRFGRDLASWQREWRASSASSALASDQVRV
jgi:glycosyltransferase involved in cell wall biosynthesis